MARKGLIQLDSKVSETTAKDLFIQFQTAKGLTDATFTNYENVWKYFFSWYGGGVNDITQRSVTDWISFMKMKGIKPVTINSYLRFLKTMLNFFISQGWILPFKISLLPSQESIKETYTDEEIRILLVRPDKRTATFAAYRDWVIISTFIGTGIRRSTLINLKVSDLDLIGGYMNMSHTKNKRANVIPISSTLLSILREYLVLSKLPSDNYLFPDTYGNPMKFDRLGKIVKHYNTSRGVARTSIHAFRHTYARLMILNGCNVFKLQKLLGHSTLDMTRHYVELFSTDLKDGYDEINPLERITASKKRITI